MQTEQCALLTVRACSSEDKLRSRSKGLELLKGE